MMKAAQFVEEDAEKVDQIVRHLRIAQVKFSKPRRIQIDDDIGAVAVRVVAEGELISRAGHQHGRPLVDADKNHPRRTGIGELVARKVRQDVQGDADLPV
ncbi:hypothetical protein ACFQU1_05425 [Chelatococcus sp. GCM10030263]|uniref:hypothetical protein n=1 Tax=Chelatococcus sp. GCM10030263 TaxID=3273387 RepID=UPI00361457AF